MEAKEYLSKFTNISKEDLKKYVVLSFKIIDEIYTIEEIKSGGIFQKETIIDFYRHLLMIIATSDDNVLPERCDMLNELIEQLDIEPITFEELESNYSLYTGEATPTILHAIFDIWSQTDAHTSISDVCENTVSLSACLLTCFEIYDSAEIFIKLMLAVWESTRQMCDM